MMIDGRDDWEFGSEPATPPDNVIPFPRMRPSSKLAEAWKAELAQRNKQLQTRYEFVGPSSVVQDIVKQRSMPPMYWPGGWPGIGRRCRTYPGDMVGIVGSQGGGKTSFAIQIAIANTGQGIPVCWANLELPRHEVTCRMVGNLHGVHAMKIRDEWEPERIEHSTNALHDMWHFVDRIRDTDKQVAAMRACVEMCWQIYKVPPLLVVDHVGKLATNARDMRIGTLNALAALLDLTTDMLCYTVVLSQGSRGNQATLTGKVDVENATDALGVAAEARQFEEDCCNVVVLTLFKENDRMALDGQAHIGKARWTGGEGTEGVLFRKPGGQWEEQDHVPPTPSKVRAEQEKDKKDKSRAAPRTSAQARADLNAALQGDAAASRRIALMDALTRHGMLGMEMSQMRKIPGVGNKLAALHVALQELKAAGAAEPLPGNKWRAVSRIE